MFVVMFKVLSVPAAIQSIASHEELKTTLVIPLVVLSELEGLAKSMKPENYKTLEDARKVIHSLTLARSLTHSLLLGTLSNLSAYSFCSLTLACLLNLAHSCSLTPFFSLNVARSLTFSRSMLLAHSCSLTH